MAQRVAGDLYESITGQLFELGRQLRQPNGYPFDAMKLKRHLQEAVEGRFTDGAVSGYSLSVDYDLPVGDAVVLGRYDWANSDITEKHFPTKRKGAAEVVVELIHFNRYVSTDEALRELDRQGYRPAELHELLAFGAKYPELQRQFSIVALGSVWQNRHGRRFVPCLDGYGSRRDLSLYWFENARNEFYRFAAVRNK